MLEDGEQVDECLWVAKKIGIICLRAYTNKAMGLILLALSNVYLNQSFLRN